jgi:uncharacterized protein YkwD
MLKTKNLCKGFVILAILLTVLVGGIFNGIGAVEIFAADENPPIIQMGNNAPMTRDEFMTWSSQRGIRFINIGEGIYPVGIFFNWANGQSYNYGELNNAILHVTLRANTIIKNRKLPNQAVSNEDSQQESGYPSSEVIEDAPRQDPMEARSAITLPNRRLTESELEEWINEYNEMNGATVFELAVVAEVNRVREQHGLRPLVLDPSLMMSARLKTQEFGDLQYFAHNSPVYGSPTEAASMFGFDGSGVAETITRSGRSSAPVFDVTPESVVRGMLESTRGHREILLNPEAYSIGFGSFFSPNSTGPNNDMSHMFYYATMFGFAN